MLGNDDPWWCVVFVLNRVTTRKRETPDGQKPSGKPEIPLGIRFLTAHRQEFADRSPLSGKVKFSCRLADMNPFLSVVPDGLHEDALKDQFQTVKTVRKSDKRAKKIYTCMQTYIRDYNFTVPANPICMIVSYTCPLQFIHTDVGIHQVNS